MHQSGQAWGATAWRGIVQHMLWKALPAVVVAIMTAASASACLIQVSIVRSWDAPSVPPLSRHGIHLDGGVNDGTM